MAVNTARLNELQEKIALDLGAGIINEDMLREFRLRWITAPDAEKDGLRYTLKDIEDFVRQLRIEQTAATVGVVARVPYARANPRAC